MQPVGIQPVGKAKLKLPFHGKEEYWLDKVSVVSWGIEGKVRIFMWILV